MRDTSKEGKVTLKDFSLFTNENHYCYYYDGLEISKEKKFKLLD